MSKRACFHLCFPLTEFLRLFCRLNPLDKAIHAAGAFLCRRSNERRRGHFARASECMRLLLSLTPTLRRCQCKAGSKRTAEGNAPQTDHAGLVCDFSRAVLIRKPLGAAIAGIVCLVAVLGTGGCLFGNEGQLAPLPVTVPPLRSSVTAFRASAPSALAFST